MPLDFLHQLLSRIGPNLAQCWMVMRNRGQRSGGCSEMHGYRDFMNQLGAFWPDDCATNDFPSCCLNNQFNETIGLTADHRFAMISELVFGNAHVYATLSSFFLGQADHCYMRFAENAEQFQPVVDFLRLFSLQNARCISGCDTSLLNRNVDYLMHASCIPSSKNMGLRCLHRSVALNRACICSFHAGGVKV